MSRTPSGVQSAHGAVRVLQVARRRARRRGSPSGRGTSGRRSRRAPCSRGRGRSTLLISPCTLHTSPIEQPRCRSPTTVESRADVARADDPRERAARVAPRRTRIGPAVASNTTNGSIVAPRLDEHRCRRRCTVAPCGAARSSVGAERARCRRASCGVEVPRRSPTPRRATARATSARRAAGGERRRAPSVPSASRVDAAAPRASRTAATRPSHVHTSRVGARRVERGERSARSRRPRRPADHAASRPAARRAPRSRRGAARRRSPPARAPSARSQRRADQLRAGAQLADRARERERLEARARRVVVEIERDTRRGRSGDGSAHGRGPGSESMQRLEVARPVDGGDEREPVAATTTTRSSTPYSTTAFPSACTTLPRRVAARARGRSPRCRRVERAHAARARAHVPTSSQPKSPGITSTRVAALEHADVDRDRRARRRRTRAMSSPARARAPARPRASARVDLVEEVAHAPDEDARVPEVALAHACARRARGRASRRSAPTRRTPGVDLVARLDVAESRVVARRHDADRDERCVRVAAASAARRASRGSPSASPIAQSACTQIITASRAAALARSRAPPTRAPPRCPPAAARR